MLERPRDVARLTCPCLDIEARAFNDAVSRPFTTQKTISYRMSINKAWHDPLSETELDEVDVLDLPAFGKHGILYGRAVDVVKDPIDDTII